MVLIKEHIVYSPCVDSYGLRNFANPAADLHALYNPVPEVFQIPAYMAVFLYLFVIEPVDLIQFHLPVFHRTQDMASAGSSDINSQIICLHVISPFCFSGFCLYYTVFSSFFLGLYLIFTGTFLAKPAGTWYADL